MVSSLILIASLQCAETKIVNVSWQPFGGDPRDQQSLNSAKARCKVHFERSPCLTTFTKLEPGAYRAMCGMPKELK